MQDAGTEEETAAAARAAAEKREERLQAQNLAYQAGENTDGLVNSETNPSNEVVMQESIELHTTNVTDTAEENDEELDP